MQSSIQLVLFQDHLHFLPWYEEDSDAKYLAMARLVLYTSGLAALLRRHPKFLVLGTCSLFLVLWFKPVKEEKVPEVEVPPIEKALQNPTLREKIIQGPRERLHRAQYVASDNEQIYGGRLVRRDHQQAAPEENVYEVPRTGGAQKFYINPKKLS